MEVSLVSRGASAPPATTRNRFSIGMCDMRELRYQLDVKGQEITPEMTADLFAQP
jgi:hypothetical protein